MSVVSIFVGLVASASLGAGAVAGVARLDTGASSHGSDVGVDVGVGAGAQHGADLRAQTVGHVEAITATTVDVLDSHAEVESHVEALPDAASQLHLSGSADASETTSVDSTGTPTGSGATIGEKAEVGADTASATAHATADAHVSAGLGIGG